MTPLLVRRVLLQLSCDGALAVFVQLLAITLLFGTALPTADFGSLAGWIVVLASLYVSTNILFGLYRSRSGRARVVLSSVTAAGLGSATLLSFQAQGVFPLRAWVLATALWALSQVFVHIPVLRSQILLICLSASVSLALGELFLRQVYDPFDVAHFVPESPYEKYRQILIEDEDLGFRLKPHGYALFEREEIDYYQMEVRISSLGIRDREYDPVKPPDTKRILFVGDSIVFGVGLNLEQTMVKLLEQKLNFQTPGDSRYEVMNWGVGSYCLRQEVGLLEKAGAAQYQPDLLLVGTGPNDFGQSLNPNTYESQTGLLATADMQRTLIGLPGKGLRGLRLYRLADQEIAGFLSRRPRARSTLDLASSREAASTREDLQRFQAYAASLGIPLGIVLFPGEELVFPGQRGHQSKRPIYEIMRLQMEELGLAYLDCLPALRAAAEASRRPLFVQWDSIHYNAEGNRVIAEQLIDFLRSQWFPSDDQSSGDATGQVSQHQVRETGQF